MLVCCLAIQVGLVIMYNLGGVSQEAASYMQRDKAPFRKQEIQAEGEKLEASSL